MLLAYSEDKERQSCLVESGHLHVQTLVDLTGTNRFSSVMAKRESSEKACAHSSSKFCHLCDSTRRRTTRITDLLTEEIDQHIIDDMAPQTLPEDSQRSTETNN